MDYKNYIESDYWKNTVEQVLDRDNHRCRLCNSNKDLHVHHRTYEFIGNEKLEELITICNVCYKIHNIISKDYFKGYRDIFKYVEYLDNEIWLDIIGFEGKYQISSLGRVGRLTKSGKYYEQYIEKILKPFTKSKKKYLWVDLYNGGKKRFSVHRLVAIHFIKNDDPINKIEVNHKDENPQNNAVDNLEWITKKDNINYGTRNKRISESKIKKSMLLEIKKLVNL